MSNKPKNQPICWPRVNKAQTTRQPPYQPIPVQAWRQKLQLLNKAIGQSKISAQSLFSQRPGPPSTLPTSKSKTDTPGTGVLSSDAPLCNITAKMTNSSNLRKSNPLLTTTHQQKNRRLLIHQRNRPRRKPLTPLVLAALSPPVNPGRTLTLPQRTSRPYRTWRRQPVKEWSFHETRLSSAREHLTRIKKRLKRMQDGQSPGTPQASPVADMEMEIID